MGKVTREALQQWVPIRVKGRRRYVLEYGLLRFGLLAGIISVPLFMLANGTPLLESVLQAVVTWSIGGFIWGRWMWARGEKTFAEHQHLLETNHIEE